MSCETEGKIGVCRTLLLQTHFPYSQPTVAQHEESCSARLV